MTMIEVKAADLIGPALDRAVSCALWPGIPGNLPKNASRWLLANRGGKFSTSWAEAGPLIEKYKVALSPPTDMVHRNFGNFDPRNGWYESGRWGSTIFGNERKHRRAAFSHPDSPLIVAMRAIVQFELGDTVQVPQELLP